MSETLHAFHQGDHRAVVRLPFALNDLLAGWAALRGAMLRERHESFTRDEWAYVISFLAEERLRAPFLRNFGSPVELSEARRGAYTLYRPRGPVALWLPSNVTLLGPLSLVLVSLTGAALRVKGSSRAEDLTGALLQFARERLDGGALADYLNAQVSVEYAGHDDPRVAAMAREAAVRLYFVGDAGARAIEALPHPTHSSGVYFSDRVSQAWCDVEALNDDALAALIRVFAVYGQAGCTSPKKIVLIDAPAEAAVEVSERLAALWPQVIRGLPEPHAASTNLMAGQWATILGWRTRMAANGGAVFASGALDADVPSEPSAMLLPVCAGSLDEAVRRLPENIQTIGIMPRAAEQKALWEERLAGTRADRVVPVDRMHHFGAVWDGVEFWRQLFSAVEVG